MMFFNCLFVMKDVEKAVFLCHFLTFIKKSNFFERKSSICLCAHTKGIIFALEKEKEG